MSVGITSVGAYIPYYAVKRETIAKAWESKGLKGERSLANADEDTITMAVEAASDCFRFIARKDVNSLYFASTTAPYVEKSNASLIATACDFEDSVFTADFAHCTKAGSSALKAAFDAAAANPGQQVLVVAADSRTGFPKSDQAQLFGDAAAALVIGTENVIATIDCFSTVNNEIIDRWRNYGETYVNNGEGRFITDEGYMRVMSKVVKDIMKKSGLTAKEISKVVFSTPGLREDASLAKKLGFAEEQVQDSLMLQVGDSGTAQPILALVAALESAKPGDRILMASYGNGANAFIFKVTEYIASIQKTSTIQRYLSSRKQFDSYGRFLSFQGIIEAAQAVPYKIVPSATAYWREQKSYVRMYGTKCKSCGASAFPINRICYACGSKDNFEEIRLSDKTAKIYTFSIDRLAGRADDPIIGQIIAEDNDQIRYYLLMTDFDYTTVKIGMEMEFAFRKMHTLGNFNNYFWKCRPVRKGGASQ